MWHRFLSVRRAHHIILAATFLLGGFLFVPAARASTVYVTSTISANTTWVSGNVYVIQGAPITINSGVTLDIASGTVIKFAPYDTLQVEGTLNAIGDYSNPIYFTSLNDNSVAPGTNGTTTSNPQEGDWSDIQTVTGASTTITNAVIRYGGSYSDNGEIFSSGGNLSLSQDEIGSSSYSGINTIGGFIDIVSSTISNNNQYGIFESGSSGNIILTSSTLNNNDSGATYIDLSGGINFIPSGNIASGIDAGYLESGTIVTSTTWYKDDLSYISNNVIIAASTTLTINHGAIIKFPSYGTLVVDGVLNTQGTSSDKVYFTSLRDNSVGGVTGNSSTSTPSIGDWGYIENGSMASSTLDNAVIRYGGSSNQEIYLLGGVFNVSNSQISSGSEMNIDAEGGSLNIVSSEIDNATYGIFMTSGTISVSNSYFHNNSSYAIYNLTNVTSSAYALGNYWDAPSGPYNLNLNPNGAGNAASDYVDFVPWLLNSPTSTKESVQFNGASGLGYNASQDEFAATDPFTIEFWYRTNTTSSVQNLLDARQSNGANYEGYSINWDWNSGIRFFMGCSSGTIYFNAASSSANSIGTTYDTNGIWHQIAITKGAGTSSSSFGFYFDGVSSTPDWTGGSQGPISGDCFVSTTTASIWLGKNISTSSPNYLTGNMDEVRIWNTQRSDSDIANNWNNEISSITGLRGLWQFDSTSTDLVTGNVASTIGSLIFSTSTTLGGHFLLDQNNPLLQTSAHNNEMLWYPNGTNYQNQIDDAGSAWNGLGGAAIASTTSSSSANIIVYDVNDPSYSWAGEWFNTTSSPPSALELNAYKLGGQPYELQEDLIMHELGHALGLDHSYFGNVMNWFVTTGSYPGPQDISDYMYLKGQGIWGN